ncbi:LysR family transcriptional regulator [Salinicola aestuarinus]|uniref:LysR family transcriptional regulator n=1 Tax=Salinicola aestuarinus TaxID=1949082 RepID=UPI000DA15197|nr:LysR family transcriptional regulator [Salinicola aestuarinus]
MVPSERLKGIETFVAAADLGSFTAAASRLNLTTSAISKSVGRLEARLETRLFARTTRRLVLTDAGAGFYATCTRVLAELADAESILAADGSEPVGRLTINLPAAFGRMQVMPTLLEFCDHHPGIEPQVVFSDRFVDLVEEGVDIAVRIGTFRQPSEALGFRHLGTESLILCAAPSYVERHRGIESIDDLPSRDAILYGRADGATTPWRLNTGDGGVEHRVMRGRMVLGSAEAQVSTVKAGFGVAQLATWLIERELESGELVEILPAYRSPGLDLHLLWQRGRQLNPKINAGIRWLGERLRID